MENNKTKDIEVTGVTQVTVKKQGVTQKTLKAWLEQGKKIREEKLIAKEACDKLTEIETYVKQGWLSKNGF